MPASIDAQINSADTIPTSTSIEISRPELASKVLKWDCTGPFKVIAYAVNKNDCDASNQLSRWETRLSSCSICERTAWYCSTDEMLVSSLISLWGRLPSCD